jgi:hypothetical protein
LQVPFGYPPDLCDESGELRAPIAFFGTLFRGMP